MSATYPYPKGMFDMHKSSLQIHFILRKFQMETKNNLMELGRYFNKA